LPIFRHFCFFNSMLASVLILFLFSGCEEKNQYQASPPPSVTVSKPLVKTVEDYVEFTGTTEAHERVEIRARVKGFLESVHFKEGDKVKKDQLLFKIDPRSFQAQVDQAAAAVKNSEVQLDKANETFQRMKKLFEKKSTSELEYIRAKASRDKAVAELSGTKALLKEAKLDLEYTEVKSPISGRIGKFEINVGNLVGDGQATLLTTVVSFSPIFAYFNMSEQELLRFIRKRQKKNRTKKLSVEDKEKIPVKLALSDEIDFSHEGYIDYADYQLDATSGTFMIRGIFPNENHDIVAGLFVRVRLADQQYDNAVMVNENAFSADMIGRYLYVVNKKNKVEKRHLQKEALGALVDGFRIIKKGISPDDLIIVNGIQRARDGIEVDPQEENTVKSESKKEAPAKKESTK
jgi:RND family efflux transporter MFP subunit